MSPVESEEDTMIVDPFNDNIALTGTGKLAGAVRIGDFTDGAEPTVAEIQKMPIIGWVVEEDQ